MRHRDVRNILYEFARDELDVAPKKQVEQHLAGCDRCFAELQVLKEGMRLVRQQRRKPSQEQSETYWRNFAIQVERRIQTSGARRPRRYRFWQEAEWLFLIRRPYTIALATSLAIVIMAALLWYGRVFPTLMESGIEPAGVPVQAVNQELSDYFRKSKILLVGISNISVPEGQRVDISVEREAARALIVQARYLDQQQIDERAQYLVRALEKILIELANLENEADLPDVEIVRAGIYQENMLFKIRMAEATYRNSPGNGFTQTVNNGSNR